MSTKVGPSLAPLDQHCSDLDQTRTELGQIWFVSRQIWATPGGGTMMSLERWLSNVV